MARVSKSHDVLDFYKCSIFLTFMSSNIERYEEIFEKDLVLEVDSNPFVPNQGKELSPLFDVMVDGITGKAGVGCFGGYSTRIVIELDEEHPELGTSFATKYFIFDENKKGLVHWGHDNKSFTIKKKKD